MKIYSIFQSVDGECNSRGIGSFTTFIRFAGCSATCSFCDTEYAKDVNSGTEMSVIDVVNQCEGPNVTITGGEPFEQRRDLEGLLGTLTIDNHNISVETNGLHSFNKKIYPYYHANWVVDIKKEGPSFLSNIIMMNLDEKDIIKQVVGSREDFLSAVGKKNALQNHSVKARFAFSPEYGKMTPNELLLLLKEFKVHDAILNVQLHKICTLTESA